MKLFILSEEGNPDCQLRIDRNTESERAKITISYEDDNTSSSFELSVSDVKDIIAELYEIEKQQQNV